MFELPLRKLEVVRGKPLPVPLIHVRGVAIFNFYTSNSLALHKT